MREYGNVSIELPAGLGVETLIHQHHALAHLRWQAVAKTKRTNINLQSAVHQCALTWFLLSCSKTMALV